MSHFTLTVFEAQAASWNVYICNTKEAALQWFLCVSAHQGCIQWSLCQAKPSHAGLSPRQVNGASWTGLLLLS